MEALCLLSFGEMEINEECMLKEGSDTKLAK